MSSQKNHIGIKQSQTLRFTPQLEKSLKILQCSQQQLHNTVESMLSQNIMLESAHGQTIYDESPYSEDIAATGADEISVMSDDIPCDINADIEWDYVYDSEDDIPHRSNSSDDGFDDSRCATHYSFDAHLERAIYEHFAKTRYLNIALFILESLDDNYFLRESYEILAKSSNYSTHDIAHAVDVIKHFTPSGVASRTVQECLLAQLHTNIEYSDVVANAHEILTQYLPYVGTKPELIAKRLNISDAEYKQALELIQGLSPYPFDESSVAATEVITPDVFVHKRMGVYYASINNDARFDVYINKEYESLAKKCNGDERHFITSQLQEAKAFIRALDQRNKTVVRVANAIVMHQQGFFAYGDSAMKPLSMQDVANLLQLHESTISRAVNGKYLSFNSRLFELKMFFSHQLANTHTNSDTDKTSVYAIKATIKQLIDNEDPQTPLSDSKIEQLLKADGIDIARRTVAKYREQLGFSKTSKRKVKI